MQVISYEQTWERVYAIKKWKKNFPELPPIKLTRFEQSIVNNEVKQIYRKIFSKSTRQMEFIETNKKWHFDEVFIKTSPSTEPGNEEFAILFFASPDKSDLQENFISKFRKKENILNAYIGDYPWQIKLSEKVNLNEKIKIHYSNIIIFLAIISILISAILYIVSAKAKKKEALKKITFLNQIVHEIRSPLTSLSIYLEILNKIIIKIETDLEEKK